MSKDNHNNIPIEEIRAYCKTQPIQRLWMSTPRFELYLRPDTDIGMMVEYKRDARIGYIGMARQEIELGEFLGGSVDLRTVNEVFDDVLEYLTTQVEPLYAATDTALS